MVHGGELMQNIILMQDRVYNKRQMVDLLLQVNLHFILLEIRMD